MMLDELGSVHFVRSSRLFGYSSKMSFRKPAVPPKRPPHLINNSKQHLSSSASSSNISPPASANGSAPYRSADDRRPKPTKDAEGNINVVVRCR